jgi:hypothetical protein
VTVRSWFVAIATVLSAVVYAITVLGGVYVLIQGYTVEGITVVALAIFGLPLIIGWLRTQLRRFASRNARPS